MVVTHRLCRSPRPSLLSAAARAAGGWARPCSSAADGTAAEAAVGDGGLTARMQRELRALQPGAGLDAPLPKASGGGWVDPTGLRRKSPDHELPPYAEASFRTLTFVMTRAPRLADFPREPTYRRDSIDLLFRHYYKRP
mmetsp:Transcript_31553/g.99210  ORF Transcript_31553/g.99210 Transcript_31553/m.99210 type:complete len:139 (+) Transcript_31553:10-426(+)